VLYDEVAKQGHRPSNVYCADEEARETTERLIRDAGYEPVSVGGLDQARMQEGLVNTTMAIASAGLGPFFYRIAPPGQL
jgi:8-hydroxy-5-deazaflavin:NADPH oxidoreductase